jgi:hypothetical protein
MTPYETLRHNLYFTVTNLASPGTLNAEAIALTLATIGGEPGIESILAGALDGPFGQIELPCDCKGIDGYVAALTELSGRIENLPVSHGPDKGAILADRERIKAEIQVLLANFNDLDEPEPVVEENVDGADVLLSALEKLLGVRLVRV